MWKKTIIEHSNGRQIELRCEQQGNSFDAVLSENSLKKQTVIVRDVLLGTVGQIRADQDGNLPIWHDCNDEFEKWSCQLDYRQGKRIYPPPIDDLEYLISHAINFTRNLRSFDKYAAKLVPGKWCARGIELSFSEDGQFQVTGTAFQNSPFKDLERGSEWHYGAGNILVRIGSQTGVRLQIIDISENQLRFIGKGGSLAYILTRFNNPN
jgi:hypothetical protein